MKSFWIVHGLPRAVIRAQGGTGAAVLGSWIDGLAVSVQRQGIDLSITVLCVAGQKLDVMVDGVRYLVVDGRTGDVGAKVKTWILDVKPDIIHVHGLENNGGSYADDVYCGVPVVVSIQGVLSQIYQAYTGGIPLFELLWADVNPRNFIRHTSIFCEQRSWFVKRARQEQFIYRRFKYFIGRTQFDHDCMRFYNPTAHYFQGEESINAAYRQVKWERAKARPFTIYCGSALGYGLKGGHWLIRAVNMLRKEFPKIELHIAAAQNILPRKRTWMQWLKATTYHVYVRRLIERLGCADCIRALPAMTPEQVAEELATVELFVLPSVCENSPNTLCEAMMVGTPSIATYAGGIPSIMRPGIEGRLVQVCDPHSLAGEIRRYFTDHDYAERYVEAARARAFERHADDKNAAALYDVYARILELEGK